MKQTHAARVVDCVAEEAAYYCHEALMALGWTIRESGEWGMICAPPPSSGISTTTFEITWRSEGRKTCLSIFGPTASGLATGLDPSSLVKELDRQIGMNIDGRAELSNHRA